MSMLSRILQIVVRPILSGRGCNNFVTIPPNAKGMSNVLRHSPITTC